MKLDVLPGRVREVEFGSDNFRRRATVLHPVHQGQERIVTRVVQAERDRPPRIVRRALRSLARAPDHPRRFNIVRCSPAMAHYNVWSQHFIIPL